MEVESTNSSLRRDIRPHFDFKWDDESKAKVQKVIAEKLTSFSIYGDDVLPEYVLVMIQNKKNSEQVSADLEAFLGKDNSLKFTTWLWDTLEQFVKGSPLPSGFPPENPAPTSTVEQKEVEEIKPRPKLSSVIGTPIYNDKQPYRDSSSYSRRRDNRDNRDRGRDRIRERRDWERDRDRDRGQENHGRRNHKDFAEPMEESKPSTENKTKSGGSARLILSAVKQAVDSVKEPQVKTEPSKHSSNRVPRRIVTADSDEDKGIQITVRGQLGKRAAEPVEDEQEQETTPKKTKLVRCTFWPNCTKGDLCEYHHPKEQCRNFPNCPFGDSCNYIHPLIPCKYGANCTRPNCAYNHPRAPAMPLIHPSTVPCKNGFACQRHGCLFQHPAEACKFGTGCVKGPACTYSHNTLCKFGPKCSRVGCTFAHATTQQKAAKMAVACKFGSNCLYKDSTCPFVHPIEDNNMDTGSLSNSLPKTPPSAT